jgi:hypothetical protein
MEVWPQIDPLEDPPMRTAFIPKLKVGDVVIEHKDGVSICAWGAVTADGKLPSDYQSGTRTDADEWAASFVEKSGGRVYLNALP